MPDPANTTEGTALDEIWVKGARGQAGEFGAQGRVLVRGDARDIYRFISRVEEQPKWNAGVKQSSVVAVDGPVSHVHQRLKWNFLAIGGEFSMNLTMTEDPQRLSIDTQMLQGSLMRNFHSQVGVKPLDGSPGSYCQVDMRLFMQPKVFVPSPIRPMVGRQVQRQLKGVLQGLKEHVEREGPGAPASGDGAFGGFKLPWGGDAAAASAGSPCGSRPAAPVAWEVAPLKWPGSEDLMAPFASLQEAGRALAGAFSSFNGRQLQQLAQLQRWQ